jgi:hypothetical protein
MNKTFIRLSVRISNDERLLQSHVSLVFALLITWIKSGCQLSFKITRREMMVIAKISSISTYHICIKELVKYNYITYTPSYDHYKGTLVSFKL